jgi:integrase
MAWGGGEVVERRIRRDRAYALRFMAYGERRYLTLGRRSDGWDPRAAEDELQNVLADVRRGFWVPPTRGRAGRVASDEEAPREVPRFGSFASGIVASRRGQVSESTTKNEEWALAHLNPYFAEWPLEEIDAESVDAYRLHKVRESEDRARAIERGRPRRNDHGQVLRPLSPPTINKTIDTLAWLLGIALDYRHVSENAASGRKRRLQVPPRKPVYLDAPAQIEALLDAGAELDRETRRHCEEREVILTALILAGPRAEELCQLLWRDVDLANERISVGRSKTQAGLREIPIRPLLHRALVAHKATSKKDGPDDLVFPHVNGGRRDRNSLRSGVLVDAFARADEILISRGHVPLPVGLSAHKLRHTFASLLVACGEDPASVMRQLGHTDPGFTLRVYTHMMVRSTEERERLKALVRGERAARPSAARPLDGAVYETEILRALAERGGSAQRKEVIAAVGEALSSRHGLADLEELPSGPPRWEPRVGKARSRFVRRGWLEDGGRSADWCLTPTGWAKARRSGFVSGEEATYVALSR